jgi:hypothetical protein
MSDYYINYVSGNDSNDGSISFPFKHCPGDPNAAGNASSTLLSGGDTVYFRNDVTYTIALTGGVSHIGLNWSGSAGNPITYDGSSWGSGTKAVIDGDNLADGWSSENHSMAFCDEDNARSYLVFRGFTITNMGGYAEDDAIWGTSDPVTSPPGGSGIYLRGGGSNIQIYNCDFEEIGQWQNQEPMSGTGSVTGTAIRLQNVTDVKVWDCDFTRMKTGVAIKSTSTISGVQVINCSFHNYMNWLIDVAPRSHDSTLSNILIDGCTFYDYKEFDTPNWAGFGEKPHQDGIFFRNSGMRGVWNNVVVRNCLFYADDTSNGGTASIFVSQGPSVDIINCVFLDDDHSNAHINIGFAKVTGQGDQTIRILNNTIVGSTRCLKLTVTTVDADVVEIRNNIFYRQVSGRTNDCVSINPANLGSLTMDNNIFYSNYFPLTDHYSVFDGSYETLESWQDEQGYDLSSVIADPDLMSISGNPSTWDAEPKASSPAMNFGAIISWLLEDKKGRFRGFPWGKGAHYPKQDMRGSWPVTLKIEPSGCRGV